jgi:hypothetical protein
MGQSFDERTGRTALTKRAGETRNLGFDLRNVLAEGDSLDGATKTVTCTNQALLTTSANVTFSTTTLSGTVISFNAAGGTDNEDYEFKITASTTDGETIVEYGVLKVRD